MLLQVSLYTKAVYSGKKLSLKYSTLCLTTTKDANKIQNGFLSGFSKENEGEEEDKQRSPSLKRHTPKTPFIIGRHKKCIKHKNVRDYLVQH